MSKDKNRDKLPEPTPEEQKEAEKSVEDWLRKKGYPDPNPKKQ